MKLMRTDLNDFARELAKTNTDALIEALKGAIQEFNENLAEQFGSNFAQLNEAVGKLLEWQENNKRDMEELRISLDKSIASIEKSAEGIERIEGSLKETAQHLNGLGDLLRTFSSARLWTLKSDLKLLPKCLRRLLMQCQELKNYCVNIRRVWVKHWEA